MRKILLVLLGIPLLLAGAVLLWLARGPVPTYEVTTGSALEPAQMAIAADAETFALEDAGEMAAEAPSGGDADGEATFAEPPGAAAPQGEPIFAAPTPAAVPRALSQETAALAEVPLTSDMVLDEAAPIEIDALDPDEARAEAEESRGGPVVPAAYEQRVVEMEWPSQFRVGGSGTVRVKLKMLEGGAVQPVAEVEGNEISAQPILIPDNYTTHNAQLTATISAPDFEIEPLSPQTQTLLPGGEAQWLWTLVAENSGRGVIAVGITLTWVAKDTGRAETPLSLWGQVLNADINYVFGAITVPQASIGGTVLAVLGFVAQIPLIDAVLEVIGKIFFGGSRRRRQKAARRR